MARDDRSSGNSARDARARNRRATEVGAAQGLSQGRLHFRRTRSRRAAERKSFSSAAGVMTDIRWDHDREARTGIPEVVFGPGKTSAHLRQLFEDEGELRIASRLSDDQMQVLTGLATIYPEARVAVRNPRNQRGIPPVPVLTAG